MKLRQLLVVVIKKSSTTILAGRHVEVDSDKLLVLGYHTQLDRRMKQLVAPYVTLNLVFTQQASDSVRFFVIALAENSDQAALLAEVLG